MAERKIVVVSEAPPRLESLDAAAARKFLKDYIAYELRLEATEAQVPMKRLLEPDDLQVLIDNSEEMDIVVVREADTVRVAGAVRSGLETPINQQSAGAAIRSQEAQPAPNVPGVARAQPDELPGIPEEEEEEGQDAPLTVAWMSNAHILEMIIYVLGPRSVTDTITILRSIRIENDPVFTKWGTATNYVREWKVAMKWCKNQLPVSKVLSEHFLAGVRPKQLAFNLKNLGIKNIEKLMKTFVSEYRTRVDATQKLAGMNVLSAPESDWQA